MLRRLGCTDHQATEGGDMMKAVVRREGEGGTTEKGGTTEGGGTTGMRMRYSDVECLVGLVALPDGRLSRS